MKNLIPLWSLVILLSLDACVLIRRPQAMFENKVMFVEPHQVYSSDRYLDLEWGGDDHCVAVPIDLTTSVQTTDGATQLLGIVTPIPGGAGPPPAGLVVAYGFYADPEDLAEVCRRLAESSGKPAAHEARYVTTKLEASGASKRPFLAQGRANVEVTELSLPPSGNATSVSVHTHLVVWFSREFEYGDVIRLEMAQRTTDIIDKERSGRIVGYSRFDLRMLRGPGVISGPLLGVGIIVLGTIALL